MNMKKMSMEDKIKLYELLTEYNQEIRSNISYGKYNTKEEFAVHMMISKHIQVIEEIKEVLSFDF